MNCGTSVFCQAYVRQSRSLDIFIWAQLQNPGPHQRPLGVAATGCAKYMRDNLHVNETIRKVTIHK